MPGKAEINEIKSFSVHFHAADGPFTKPARTPEEVKNRVLNHIGGLFLNGDVATNGIIRWVGVTAKCALGKRDLPKRLFRPVPSATVDQSPE